MIEVKHDHKLNFPTIEVPMTREGGAGTGPEQDSVVKQSDVEGILAPLLRYNNMSITLDQIRRLRLSGGSVPYIDVEIKDSMNLIKDLDAPGMDNFLYLQILPPFDDAYKKVQLRFQITSSHIEYGTVYLSGVYYLPHLYDRDMKAYGMVSTYQLFEEISNKHSLGFCSNVEDTQDKRFIYNPNIDDISLLNQQITYAGNDKHVFEWWIDFWNNINLVDIYNEYTTIYPDDDLKIWIDSVFFVHDQDNKNEPELRTATFTNSPIMFMDPLYIRTYKPITGTTQTDQIVDVYSINNQEVTTSLIQDGDVKYNTQVNYNYGGEYFGNFDYLTRSYTRNLFLSKLYSQSIEVHLCKPLLGIFRGSKVNLLWYNVNSYMTADMDTTDIESNIPLPDDSYNVRNSEMTYVLDRTVSGQYYISDITIEYEEGKWDTTVILNRSAEDINKVNPPDEEILKN